ncbi:PASTA domain-containing protein [Nonomuraea ceibae]|uniref:PASTA domain-containing protein n=1 Tax=Nonomuraea ceibae TaxID=1935170 RepID=UPI001C5E5D36
MGSNSKGAGCLAILDVLVIVGGCMQMFGYESEPEKPSRRPKPPAQPVCPDLVGKTLVEAENAARAMDIQLDDEGIGPATSCDDKTDCAVFRMSPQPGTVVEKHGEVAVTWITGDESAWYNRGGRQPAFRRYAPRFGPR